MECMQYINEKEKTRNYLRSFSTNYAMSTKYANMHVATSIKNNTVHSILAKG